MRGATLLQPRKADRRGRSGIGWLLATGLALACAGSASAADPDFAERLEKLAADFERLRIEHHVPGAAIAVVRGDEVVMARGFGAANIEDDIAATADTTFFIGSTTKAFTATLVGMLVDDGKMSFDDPVVRHLPYFKLAIDSDDPKAEVTIRDLLSHRTGYPRMGMLWAGGALDAEGVLRAAVNGEPYAPFRSRFYYNNVTYSAAGFAAGAAGGATWDALISSRIFDPLGMNSSGTSVRKARATAARAYSWDEHNETHTRFEPSADSPGVDAVGPAGSITSSASDMAKWLRFLLAHGAVDGKQIASKASMNQTWAFQIAAGPGVGYGMGWMMREWQGQRLIAHDGAVPGGFSTVVALLPDSDLGFVVMANAFPTVFPGVALELVSSTLLGEWPDVAAQDDGEDFEPYLGRYVANFATFSNEVFTVLEKDGRLALDIPSQMVFELKPPDDEGKWYFTLTDTIAVSFEKNASGEVDVLRLHQAGMNFEVLREGVEIAPDIPLDELARYLATFNSATPPLGVRTLIQNNRLAVEVAGGPVFDLHPPDTEGRWSARANEALGIVFKTDDDGTIVGASFHRPGGAPVIELAAASPADALPSIASLLATRAAAVTSPAPPRTTQSRGRVHFPHVGIEGAFRITTAGADRFRIDIDLGRFGSTTVVLDGDRGWRGSSFEMEPVREVFGAALEQLIDSHPARVAGEWTRFFDTATVLERSELDGQAVYIVKLQREGGEPIRLSVDAATGDVLRAQTNFILPGVGALPVTSLSTDYREVEGMRVAFRSEETNEQAGRTVYEVEEFAVNVEVDDGFFRP